MHRAATYGTQIAPDIKSKYNSFSPSRAFFLPFCLSPRPQIPSAQRTSSSDLHPRIRRRARRRGRRQESASFNLRGIILRMPRLVALLDEEENKLYSQVFSRVVGRDVRRQREGRKDYRCALGVLPGRISDTVFLPITLPFSLWSPRAFGGVSLRLNDSTWKRAWRFLHD